MSEKGERLGGVRWGGKREGAGRKALPPDERQGACVAFRLRQAQAAQLAAQARPGESVSQAARRILASTLEECEECETEECEGAG